MNSKLAVRILNDLKALGVKEICFCPGSRNAPLLIAVQANLDHFQILYFFEERSAAFFALGRIRQTGKPVAVMTTSGTAAAELLPATMEAHYAGLPLILVTADRPRSYRGSGAPQAAEQVNLYGPYVSDCLDLEHPNDLSFARWSWNRPFHVNVCFDEPLLEPIVGPKNPYRLEHTVASRVPDLNFPKGEMPAQKIETFIKSFGFPLVIVGSLHPTERGSVKNLLQRLGAPAYLESLSGLREDPDLQFLRIHLSDGMVERAQRADYPFDSVLRIGGMPTLRFWRDLEGKFSKLRVLTLSPLPFTGLSRNSDLVQGDLSEVCKIFADALGRTSRTSFACEGFLELDRKAESKLRELLDSEPTSEPGLIAAFSRKIEPSSRVYLGNSLPIREWDLAATREAKNLEVWGSRGVNGIDGQVSTFLGYAEGASNWMLIGDLTALYDLPGPWILSQLPELFVNLVVMNNGGGKIFSRMYPQKEFQNSHQVRFKAWADLWGLSYGEWRRIPENLDAKGQRRIIEIIPDDAASQRFWRKFQDI